MTASSPLISVSVMLSRLPALGHGVPCRNGKLLKRAIFWPLRAGKNEKLTLALDPGNQPELIDELPPFGQVEREA
jgi:hypothetical protein